MNKQEAIETIKQDKIQLGRIAETNSGVNTFQRKIEMVDYVPLEIVVSMIDKIDEQQKPVVPKFVAEWIEECKRSGWHLQKALSRLDDDEKVGDWAYDENDDLIPEKVDMIARAWLAYPNITVEKEKLYTVEIPNPNGVVVCLERLDGGKIALSTFGESKLTESEIKKDFEWAWQWAKEVETDE